MLDTQLTWPILPFAAFTASPPLIPTLYWDAVSYEQRIKQLAIAFEKVNQYSDTLSEGINENHDAIVDLDAEFDDFKASGFDEYYEVQVQQWIDKNLDLIFTHTAKQVLFGLTTDGYFVAYVPQSWDDITFDTGADYSLDTYGRLILRWETESTHPVDQTPEPNHHGIIGG